LGFIAILDMAGLYAWIRGCHKGTRGRALEHRHIL
jgi:hypothetical protein